MLTQTFSPRGLTIGKRVGLGYVLAVFIILLIGIVSYFSITQLLKAATWVEHTHVVMNKIDVVYTDMIEVENSQRGYLLDQR